MFIGELTGQQTTSHEFVELDGTRGKLKLVLKQQGKGSGSGNLTTAATGKGEILFDLTGLAPSHAKLELRTDVELDFDGKRLALRKTSVMSLAVRPCDGPAAR